MPDKSQLRRRLRRTRAGLGARERARAARRLAAVLHRHPLYRNARRLAAYRACGSEIDPAAVLARAHRDGKSIWLPVILGRQLGFAPPGKRLRPNRHGIAEPAPPRRGRQCFSLVLVPLLGVDAGGFRLGQGGGYYDRSFALRRRRGRLIGLAFDSQLVERLPRDFWDRRLDALATPSGLYLFGDNQLRWDSPPWPTGC